MTLHYEIVDVFTDTPFAGNPLAVVLDGDNLTTSQMQALAREFNLSETAFVLRSNQADYRLRIFTPTTELPFAGHPSVGAAHTLVRLGRIAPGRLKQECAAGVLPIMIADDMVTLTGPPAVLGTELSAGPLLEAVGLSTEDFMGTAPRIAGCGLGFGYLHVRPEAVERAHPVVTVGGLGLDGQGGISVFAWTPDSWVAHARVFGAEVGVAEDPATGSAALGLGVFLVQAGLLPADGTSLYAVRQGMELLRPSLMHCSVSAVGGEIRRTMVSGAVSPVAAGEIMYP